MIPIDFCEDLAIFDLDTAFWNSRLEYFKMIKMLLIREKLSDLHQIWCGRSYLGYWPTLQKWKKSIRKCSRLRQLWTNQRTDVRTYVHGGDDNIRLHFLWPYKKDLHWKIMSKHFKSAIEEEKLRKIDALLNSKWQPKMALKKMEPTRILLLKV